MLELYHNEVRIGEVYAMHLDGDSSPEGHRYHLCDDTQSAKTLHIYTERPAKDLELGSICSLKENDSILRLLVTATYDLRDHGMVKAEQIKTEEAQQE
jgi:hypothetical protein